MRALALLSLTLLTASPLFSSSAFAGEHCKCTKKCMTSCEKGNSKNCHCKSCDCAKNKKCSESEGQCKADSADKT